MRFMCLWRPGAKQTWKDNDPVEGQRLMVEMGKLIEDMKKSGVLIETGGWDPRSPSTVVSNAHGEVTVKDGPYSESKEVIAGFALIECKSREEAIEHKIGRAHV